MTELKSEKFHSIIWIKLFWFCPFWYFSDLQVKCRSLLRFCPSFNGHVNIKISWNFLKFNLLYFSFTLTVANNFTLSCIMLYFFRTSDFKQTCFTNIRYYLSFIGWTVFNAINNGSFLFSVFSLQFYTVYLIPPCSKKNVNKIKLHKCWVFSGYWID